MADISRLIDQLRSTDPKTFAEARDALLQLKDQALEPLLAAASGPDTGLRVHAGFLLLHCLDPRAMAKLIELTRDPEERVRFTAASYLAHATAGVEAAKAALHEMVHEESNSASIRNRALQSLEKLGDGESGFESRLAMLNSNDPQTLREAIAGLGRDRRAVEPLIALLSRQPDYIPAAAMSALASLRDPRGFDAIARHLQSPKPFLRAMAAQALGEMGDQRAIPLLEPLAGDAAFAFEEDRGPRLSVGDVVNQALVKLGARPAKGGRGPWWKLW
jgi:HEAT repeat protein